MKVLLLVCGLAVALHSGSSQLLGGSLLGQKFPQIIPPRQAMKNPSPHQLQDETTTTSTAAPAEEEVTIGLETVHPPIPAGTLPPLPLLNGSPPPLSSILPVIDEAQPQPEEGSDDEEMAVKILKKVTSIEDYVKRIESRLQALGSKLPQVDLSSTPKSPIGIFPILPSIQPFWRRSGNQPDPEVNTGAQILPYPLEHQILPIGEPENIVEVDESQGKAKVSFGEDNSTPASLTP